MNLGTKIFTYLGVKDTERWRSKFGRDLGHEMRVGTDYQPSIALLKMDSTLQAKCLVIPRRSVLTLTSKLRSMYQA